ncbi:lecithin retinol acyltransferase family protein [Treponema sp. OMZ 787]|uniref:lecithin retinol acyltransferase family protein n=1 Tax=Treponema sp. OMZ 787 TaxID=2563669 RepID=UPI0020A37B11|nr:lecithin retinol acyltransferase family protein [Treponema sp. OMZ 787]UTC63339.1 lecithin retinol acyltransferase family protein [Treponema sp. OMZ 787]
MNKNLKEKFSLGDILFVDRGLYQHYGIYAGNGRVIHYADKLGDFGNDICIQEVSLETFAKGAEIKICNLPSSVKQYTGEETVERARSRLGEEEYNLIFNNCEHFAVWCKTGISDSSQVNKVLKGAAYVAAGLTLAAAIYGILKNIETDSND